MKTILPSLFATPSQKLIKNSFLRNTVLSISGISLNVILLGLYFLVLARALGPKEYGAFVAILALSRVFGSFASWGYGHLLIKNVSRNPSSFREYWGTALMITMIGGFSSTLLVLVISKVFLHLSIPIFTILLIAYSDLVFAGVVALSQQAYLSFDKMFRYVQLQAGASAFRLAGAVLMLLTVQEPSVFSWSILYFITGMVPSIIGVILVNKELGRHIFKIQVARSEIVEGFYFSVSQSSQSIYNDIDKTLLASMTSLEIAGLYTAAYRFVEFSFSPISGLLVSSYANFFRHGAHGIRGSLNWAKKIIPWASAYGFLAALLLYLVSKVIPLFLGSAYDQTTEILQWLSPLIIFKSVELLIANILTGAGYQGVRTTIQLSLAVLNVVVSIWMISLYGWFGAVLASIGNAGLAVLSFSIAVLIISIKQKCEQI